MSCSRYNSYNYTVKFIRNSYEGIPVNFLINITAFTLLILLFIIIRKKAWNYGDIALLNKPITTLEVSPRRSVINKINEDEVSNDEEHYTGNSNESTTNEQSVFWRVIPLFIKMSDKCLEKKYGCDAKIYCVFQRMLILICVIMTVLCLTIIVPLNLTGNLQSNDSSNFKTLTIANIDEGSSKLFVHLSIAFLLMLFVFFISNRFLRFVDEQNKEERCITLMITKIPIEYCDEAMIEQHFREAYPSLTNIRVQKTYAIGKLFDLYTKKVLAEEALEFCVTELEHFNRRVKVIPNTFGRICISCKCCEAKYKSVDGIEFYSEEVKQYTEFFSDEQKDALEYGKLPIFFVSFDSIQHALLIRKEYIYQNYYCIKQYPKSQSSLSVKLNSDNWKVIFAPTPKDILWENLHKRGWKLWLKIIFINIFVALIVIILSTPAVILSYWNHYFQSKLKTISISWISQFFPSLILVLVTTVIHFFVCWANEMSAHWTRTKQSIAIMNKLFTVLVLTVLILPSLGLTSAHELIGKLLMHNSSITNIFSWKCIFLADGGALFCNYLISAAFIGMGLEILRLDVLFLIIVKLCSSRSLAEKSGITKSLLWEFPYGINYAWTLALFSIISAYAVIVPLITPFGLVYLISKHLVDRYNMIHVNVPVVIDNTVHVNAVKLLQICLIFTQATVTIYLFLKEGGIETILGFCLAAFILGIILTVGRSLRRSILSMALIKYSKIPSEADQINILQPSPHITSVANNDLTSSDGLRRSEFAPIQITQENNRFVERMRNRVSVVSITENVVNSSANENNEDPLVKIS